MKIRERNISRRVGGSTYFLGGTSLLVEEEEEEEKEEENETERKRTWTLMEYKLNLVVIVLKNVKSQCLMLSLWRNQCVIQNQM
jgi:hypothetical protein